MMPPETSPGVQHQRERGVHKITNPSCHVAQRKHRHAGQPAHRNTNKQPSRRRICSSKTPGTATLKAALPHGTTTQGHAATAKTHHDVLDKYKTRRQPANKATQRPGPPPRNGPSPIKRMIGDDRMSPPRTTNPASNPTRRRPGAAPFHTTINPEPDKAPSAAT